MIRLTKPEKPPILAEHEDEWTEDYLRSVREGQNPPDSVRFRYRHADIKATIKQETSEKCAYCESKVTHVHPGETDHIRPVSKHPELIVRWENLTFVCSACNREKSDYDSEDEPLVHPYEDDPEVHIRFLGPMAVRPPGDQLGFRTIQILQLNRSSLFERRLDKLHQLQQFLDGWANMAGGLTKELMKREILDYAQRDKEFAALVRCFLKQQTEWPEEDIRGT